MATSSVKSKDTHEYECLSPTCKFKWPNFAGPQSCPMCQGNQIKWLTYKETKSED